jgi:hypothetical protein
LKLALLLLLTLALPVAARPLNGLVSLGTTSGPLPATSGVVYIVPDTQENWQQLHGLAQRVTLFRNLVRQTAVLAQGNPDGIRQYNASLLRLKGLLNRLMITAQQKAETTTTVSQGQFSVPEVAPRTIVVVSAQTAEAADSPATFLGWWLVRDDGTLPLTLDQEQQLYQFGIPGSLPPKAP